MSRSTPLTNLPNVNNQNQNQNTNDENENQLVKEILQEIDTNKNPLEQLDEQLVQPSQISQQQHQQQQQQAENVEQHMLEQEQMHNQMLNNMNTNLKSEPDNLVIKLLIWQNNLLLLL